MKAIQTGNTFRIYDNSLKTFDQLPPQAYLVNFSPQQGFFLTLYSDITLNEKVYGVHEAKVKKVFNSFKLFNRNLGVILSGDKGIGKSLFSKMLAKSAIEQGFPLIIVNQYVRGIAEYLNDIEQEVVVIFDEFDKTFKGDDGFDPQAEMLTLFDGIAQGKKLFIITCNEINRLNDFMVNRPGRFHYHFRFSYPSTDEIREYLQDNIKEQYWDEINKVSDFAGKVNLNYDCLRSIAFELDNGESFEDAIKDLNIVHINKERYSLILVLSNGAKLKRNDMFLDLFGDDELSITFYDEEVGDDLGYLTFSPSDNEFDYNLCRCAIKAENLQWKLSSWIRNAEDDEGKAMLEKYKNVKPVKLIFNHPPQRNIHYAV